MTPEQKEWIDGATYMQLLAKWRFADIGDPFFTSEAGHYFTDRMAKLRVELGNDEHVRVSKKIGW
jgi:hypothetical protein